MAAVSLSVQSNGWCYSVLVFACRIQYAGLGEGHECNSVLVPPTTQLCDDEPAADQPIPSMDPSTPSSALDRTLSALPALEASTNHSCGIPTSRPGEREWNGVALLQVHPPGACAFS